MNARYYDGSRGQFISQDPQFWDFNQAWLFDPQNQNSYAYGRNNPIVKSDPTGKSIWSDIFGGVKTAYAPTKIYLNYQRTNNTTLSIPLRDNNIDSKSGKITGDVYSLVQNQGIVLNRTNHEVNSLESTSLKGVKQNTILGAIDLGQKCTNCLTITGGTEIGPNPLKPMHSLDHGNGYKLDFSLNKEINNIIQNNFSSIGNRGEDNAPGYKDNLQNKYWKESDHWDVKYSQNYQYNGYTLKLN